MSTREDFYRSIKVEIRSADDSEHDTLKINNEEIEYDIDITPKFKFYTHGDLPYQQFTDLMELSKKLVDQWIAIEKLTEGQ